MELKDIVIAGNGGFAKEVAWLIERLNQKSMEWNFLGFIDNKKSAGVIGDDSFVRNRASKLHVAIGIGNVKIRRKIFEEYKENKKVVFPNLVDPSVIMSRRVDMGEGNIICANSVFTVDIQLGSFDIINLGCTIGHETKMGNFVTVNPGTNVSGNVSIGSLSEIGTGVRIIQGIQVGEGTVIGAGAVIVRDIPGTCTVVGVPGKVIKFHGQEG
ncbi:MAG TPA: transferase [Lachnospiraceae bacterium]|nr:transferase [Lachnospiraceae bacterium]